MRLKMFLMFCLIAPAAFGQVMINEMMYDNVGTDDPNILYTELYGPAGTSLTGWSLVGINGNGGAVYLTVTLSGSIPEDGYFVVGGGGVTNVDQVSAHDWQNAGSASGESCDGLDLRNSSGQTVDHICYGQCDADDVCDGEGGANAPDPFPAQGVNYPLGRIPDHSDTDHNDTDFSQLETLTPGLPNSGTPCEPINAALEDLRENDDNGVPSLLGEFVVVRGVVNVNNYTLDSLTESNYFIQDDNAGCNVFRGSAPAGIAEGDCVEVSGWVGQFNGLTELVSSGAGNCTFRVVDLESTAPVTPQVLTGASFFEAFEGMLIEIRNVTIVGGESWPSGPGFNTDVDVTDGNGVITIHFDGDSPASSAPQPTGAFTIRGIATQFDDSSPYTGNYQLTPRYVSDVVTGVAVGDDPISVAGNFTLVNSYPNPFNGIATIEFAVGSAREIKVSITDVLGREVFTNNLNNLAPGTHRMQWSPTGAAGLYFVRAISGASIQTTKLLYLK